MMGQELISIVLILACYLEHRLFRRIHNLRQ